MDSSATAALHRNLALGMLHHRRNSLRFFALACGCDYRDLAKQELATAQARVDSMTRQIRTPSGEKQPVA